MVGYRKTVGVLGDGGACSAGERRRSGEAHACRIGEHKLILSSPRG